MRKASDIQIHTVTAAFKCQRCEHVTRIEQLEGRFVESVECENDVCGKKRHFQELPSESTQIDRQIIEVQQPPEERIANQPAHGINVILDDDLAGLCNCGDRVEVVGSRILLFP